MKKGIVLLLIAVACGVPLGEGSFTLRDGSIDGPDRINGTETKSFSIANVGEFGHTLVVADSEGRVVAATDLVAAGADASLDVDLEAGTYSVTCRIVTEDQEGNLIDHYELGMHRTVIVDR